MGVLYRLTKWLALAAMGGLCLPAAFAQGLLAIDTIKILSSTTRETAEMKTQVLSGVLNYTLDTTSAAGKFQGKGTFTIQPPAVPPSSGFNFAPPAIFNVVQEYDISMLVTVTVRGSNLQPCTSNQWVFRNISCSAGLMDTESTPDGPRAYFDVTLRAQLVAAVTLELRVYFKLQGKQPCTIVGVDHIEVVQVVQDVKNSLPLIANKPTVARVFFKIADPPQPPPAGIGAVLRAFRDGKELPNSPLSPFSGPVKVLNLVDREELTQSLNFDLPKEWLGEGQLDLKAEAVMPPCELRSETLPFTGSTSVTLGTVLRDGRTKFSIGWFPFCYGSDKSCPEQDKIPSYDFLLKRFYPIPPDDVVFSRIDLPAQPPWKATDLDDLGSEFIAHLNQLRDLTEAKFYDQFVGILPPVTSLRGTSDGYYALNFGRARVVLLEQRGGDPDTPISYPQNATHKNANSLAHEIAHNLGRRHTHSPSTANDDLGCGDLDKSTDWPYKTADVQEVGFDPEIKLVIPTGYADFMSYCINYKIPDWVSPYTYSQLALGNLQPHAFFFNRGAVPQPRVSMASDAVPASPTTQLVVRGWVNKDGTAGGLDPAYKVVSSEPPLQSLPEGTHCLRSSGASGQLSEFCFQPSFEDIETGEPLGKSYFAWKISFPDGVTKVTLTAQGNEVSAITAGSAPPTLTILTPQAGEQWNAGTRTITWTASSPDGMKLFYAVLYSSDGGQSWLPMAVSLTDSQFTFNPAQIAGGKNVAFRVLATDGLLTTTAEVGPIDVVQVPAINLGSGVVDFHNQTVGARANQTLVISNSGSGPLTVSAFASDNAAFRLISPRAPLTITAGIGAELTVEWLVGGSGAQTANLTISSNDPGKPQATVLLKGFASGDPVPNINVAPSALDFGTVASGATKELKFTINNSGSGKLTVNSITSSSAPFSVVSPSTPFTIAAGDSSSVTVRFTPNAGGSVTATLTIASNDPSRGSVPVSLSGSTTAPANPVLSVSPSSLDFGGVSVGQTKDLVLTISNGGGAPLTVNTVISATARFSVVNPNGLFTLSAGVSQAVTIRFAPNAAGAQTGSLTISTNDPARPSLNVPLTGTGAALSTPILTVSPASLAFGNVTVGKAQSLNLTISNTGTAPLSVSSISSDNGVFSPSVSAASVAAGATFTVSVQFAPTVTGSQNGTLKLTGNDPAHPTVMIPLTGTGVAGTSSTVTLAVDGGTFSGGVGLQNAETAVFVNRLTPPSYPATLTTVQVYFGNRSTGLPLNAPITLVAASNPSGSANISAASAGVIKLYATQVVALGSFNTYILSPPMTITSGDFVVGFTTPNPAGLFPADEDQVTPSKGRSYVSTDGLAFAVVDTYGQSVAGNFGFRAVVTLGGTAANEPASGGKASGTSAGNRRVEVKGHSGKDFATRGVVEH